MNNDVVYLHRIRGPSWGFRPDPKTRKLTHQTRYGTVYILLNGHPLIKPFWIGEVRDEYTSAGKRTVVFTVENRIGATMLDFPNGGKYWFPR